MEAKQQDTQKEASKRNYDFIEYFRKSYELMPNPECKELAYYQLLEHEAIRDYHIESLRQVNHLLQIDQQPNFELTEPKEELYKISVSFRHKCK